MLLGFTSFGSKYCMTDKGSLPNTYPFFFLYVKLRNRLLPPNHADRAASLNALGVDYYCFGDYNLAFLYFNRALNIEKALHGGEHGHTNISKLLGHLAYVYDMRGDKYSALDHFFRALKIEQEILPPQHFYIGFRYRDIAAIYASNDNFELAFLYYCRALSILEGILPTQHIKYICTTRSLVTILEILVNNYCLDDHKCDAKNILNKTKSENIHYLQEGLDILNQRQLLTQSIEVRAAANRLGKRLKKYHGLMIMNQLKTFTYFRND